MDGRRNTGLIERLRERGVLRVAASYAIIAWLALQIADVVLEPWDLPGWVERAPLVIALLGFPIALVLAWFFELGDAGVVPDTAPAGDARPTTRGFRRYADIAIISVLGAIVAFFVLRDSGWLGDAARPGAAVESSSIAVLPFTNLGGAAERHVSDGLSDELRNQFSRMQSLTVTARSSSIAFQGQAPALDAVTIAAKLGVAALLEGTVGRDRGRLRVSVQLVDGRNGKVMWAERYDRPDADLLAVQSDIASAVVAAVLPRFAASGQAAPPPPTEDPVAYDLYLLGREKLRDAESAENWYDDSAQLTAFAQAADLFRSAIAADPKFAQAYASLARALLSPALQRIDEATLAEQAAAVDREVLPHIERAIELDPRNAEAWFVKGRLLTNTMRPGATEAFERAVQLEPSHAPATMSLGWSALAEGRVDERHRLVMRAVELDPMDLANHLATFVSAWALGRHDDLRAIVARILALFPDAPAAVLIACDAAASLGEQDEALACIVAARERFDGQPEFIADLDALAGFVSESLGQDAWALQSFERAAPRDPYAALQALRLRGDVAGLRRAAGDALRRRLSPYDADIGTTLARAGLVEEALAVYRHAGLPELMGPWFRPKPIAINDYLRMIALMRMHGHADEAERHLALALPFTETIRRHGGRSFGLRLAGARAYALAGRHDEAFEQLGLAAEVMDYLPDTVATIEKDPTFAGLRDDPRFALQMKRMRDQQARIVARLPETFRRHGLAWPQQ